MFRDDPREGDVSPSESLQGRPFFKAEMRKLEPADQYKGKGPEAAWRWGLELFLWLEGYSGDQLLNPNTAEM